MASVEQEIVAFFESKGLTKAQAAGIAGNARQESSYNINASGGGLFQDIGSRATSGTGSLGHQLEAAWSELQGTHTLARLRTARTPQEAARVFSQEFERPGIPELSKREQYAMEADARTNNSPGFNEVVQKFLLDPGYGADAVAKLLKGEGGSPEGIPEAISGTNFNPIKGTEAFLQAITEPSTWLRLAEGIGGIILFMVGLKTLTRGTTGATVINQQSRSVRGVGVKTGRVIAGVAK